MTRQNGPGRARTAQDARKAPKPTVEPSTIRVRPRAGYILAGIPATGADVPADLAHEWIRNGLVTEDR